MPLGITTIQGQSFKQIRNNERNIVGRIDWVKTSTKMSSKNEGMERREANTYNVAVQ